jgi:SAM-dependent methyltransferase
MTSNTFQLRSAPFAGTLTIVQMNWPRYVLAGVIVVTTAMPIAFDLPPAIRVALWSAASLALFWVIMSVVGAHIVYDRSDLFTWRWMRDVLEVAPTRWINIHAGLNSLPRPIISRLFPKATGLSVDIFDPTEMTEASIHRARVALPMDPHSLPGRFDHLPIYCGDADVAFIILAAHELRRDESRLALFRELHRVVRAGGTVVLVEHVRNLANFIAFGPGAFHFFSRRNWMRAATAGGFDLTRELSFLPLVHAFILRRSS